MDLLREEQKITLYFQKNENMVEMVCTIAKVYDDRLDLILPQYFMRYINFLQVGCRLTAKAFSKLGTVDFNTVVISSPLEETFTIELDYNSLKLMTGSELPVINATESMEVTRIDGSLIVKTFEISTEYIKFYCDKKLEIGETLNCSIKLPKDYGIINFKASVLEVDSIYDNEYKALYVSMPGSTMQTLLYYMYVYTKDSD